MHNITNWWCYVETEVKKYCIGTFQVEPGGTHDSVSGIVYCLHNSFKHSNPVTADLQIQSNISQVPLDMMQEWPYLIVIVTRSVHMSACVLRSNCHLHSMHVAEVNFWLNTNDTSYNMQKKYGRICYCKVSFNGLQYEHSRPTVVWYATPYHSLYSV